jgi:hypothetical protein
MALLLPLLLLLQLPLLLSLPVQLLSLLPVIHVLVDSAHEGGERADEGCTALLCFSNPPPSRARNTARRVFSPLHLKHQKNFFWHLSQRAPMCSGAASIAAH